MGRETLHNQSFKTPVVVLGSPRTKRVYSISRGDKSPAESQACWRTLSPRALDPLSVASYLACYFDGDKQNGADWMRLHSCASKIMEKLHAEVSHSEV